VSHRRQPTDEEILCLLAECTAIKLPTFHKSTARVSARGLQRTLVVSDFHFPNEDPAVISILLQVIRDWQPHVVVLNGDLADMHALCRFPKDIKHRWTLSTERRAMHAFLFQLHEATPANCRIIETNANHSGGNQVGRWRRYLSENLGDLADLPSVIEALEYTAIWHPKEKWSRIELADTFTITKALIALHGNVVRSKAAYSANRMLEKYRVNLIHGHTHRMGQTGYRVPGVGDQTSHQMRAIEGGCCCKLEVDYGDAMDWQQGFVLVTSTPEGHWNSEQVLVHEGVAVVSTLGGVYRA